MKFTKILAFMLAMMLCIGVFAACNGNTETPDADLEDPEDAGVGTTVAIKIVDHEENVIYENAALEVDLTIDAAEDGNLYIGQILALCEYWKDEQVELDVDYTDDENGFIAINGMKEERIVEQEEQIVEPDESEEADDAADAEAEDTDDAADAGEATDPVEGEGEEEEEEDKEPETIIVDVEYWYYWTMTIGEDEVAIDSEIKLGDSVILKYAKDNVADLIEGEE